ncbi:hypothetical protein LMG24235_08452 [Paraburkholderia sabiae]|nr:hypothetical protein LMG24235_08452 [Paraburkholderia sabiae]
MPQVRLQACVAVDLPVTDPDLSASSLERTAIHPRLRDPPEKPARTSRGNRTRGKRGTQHSSLLAPKPPRSVWRVRIEDQTESTAPGQCARQRPPSESGKTLRMKRMTGRQVWVPRRNVAGDSARCSMHRRRAPAQSPRIRLEPPRQLRLARRLPKSRLRGSLRFVQSASPLPTARHSPRHTSAAPVSAPFRCGNRPARHRLALDHRDRYLAMTVPRLVLPRCPPAEPRNTKVGRISSCLEPQRPRPHAQRRLQSPTEVAQHPRRLMTPLRQQVEGALRPADLPGALHRSPECRSRVRHICAKSLLGPDMTAQSDAQSTDISRRSPKLVHACRAV